MKKVIVIILFMFLLTGCTNVSKLSYDQILGNISTISNRDNTYRTGYSYYLPRNMRVRSSTLYNEDITDSKYKYYLYVDLVSFSKDDKYLVEIMYNYAKIEVIVDEDGLNEAMLSIIYILKSIEYNNRVIENLMGDDVLNFNEEEFNIFNTKGSENNYITVDDDYEEEEEKIHDPDLIN